MHVIRLAVLPLAFLVAGAPAVLADRLTVPKGKIINIALSEDLDTRTVAPGERFRSTVSDPVYVDERIAIPVGSVIEGVVSIVKSHEQGYKSGVLGLQFDTLRTPDGESYPLSAALTGFRTQPRPDEEPVKVKTSARAPVLLIGREGEPGKRASSLVGNVDEDVDELAERWALSGLSAFMAEAEAGTELTIEMRRNLKVDVPD